MRQLYEIIIKIKWNTLCSKLCWSHYREIISLKNENEIKYYLSECESNNLTQRQLHELIKQNTYNRLDEKTKEKIINNEQLKIDDLIPNPIIIKRKSIDDKLSEYALRQLILNNIDLFLKQLGIGFSYIGSEYRIKIGNVYNYIDILLFNYEYNCFVVIELKVTELKKEHIGQIQVYMNYIDDNLKSINQNKTIGIIICKEDNEYIIKYCSDERVITRRYELKNIT